MARLLIEGWEHGSATLLASSYGNSPTIASGTSNGFKSNYVVSLGDDSLTYEIPNSTSLYLAFKFKKTANNHTRMLAFHNGSTSIATLSAMSNGDNTAHYIQLYRGDDEVYNDATLFYNSPVLLSHNVVRQLEMYYVPKLDATGIWTVKIDGRIVANVTSTQTAKNTTTINRIRIGAPDSCNQMYVDDLIVDSSNWIGNTIVVGLQANAVGNSAQWTPSATGFDNYTLVDEFPPSSTDYISTTSTNQTDTYNTTTLALTPETIKSVQVTAIAKYEGNPSFTNLGIVARVNGTDYISDANALTTNYRAYNKIWETNPNTAAPWVKSDIDSLEIGIKSLA